LLRVGSLNQYLILVKINFNMFIKIYYIYNNLISFIIKFKYDCLI